MAVNGFFFLMRAISKFEFSRNIFFFPFHILHIYYYIMSDSSSTSKKEIYNNPIAPKDKGRGTRVNGKDWKLQKDAMRVRSLGGNLTWEQKKQKRLEEQAIKAKIRELKEEKEGIRKSRIEETKRRQSLKEEKERYERMAQVMHRRKVERLKRKEKRNKLLKER
ncbi:BA75_01810T0 [Komagataella pastoris]|uniref:rRNA-processing protein CGR1 n=1 Tax=Komagataella pastoris TaxID=4922 RepID=A0A1B2J7B2_PICPA|nr:BA75_01810T0 [Komagataella pastoris]